MRFELFKSAQGWQRIRILQPQVNNYLSRDRNFTGVETKRARRAMVTAIGSLLLSAAPFLTETPTVNLGASRISSYPRLRNFAVRASQGPPPVARLQSLHPGFVLC